MPRKAKEISTLEVKRISKPGRHAVGFINGLLLVVKESGAKSWILRTVVGGKRKNIGLGSYPEISLADAREKARETKKIIKQGLIPSQKNKPAKLSL